MLKPVRARGIGFANGGPAPEAGTVFVTLSMVLPPSLLAHAHALPGREGRLSRFPPSPPTCQLRRPPARRVPLPTPYPLACPFARARSRDPRQGGSSPLLSPSPPTCQLRRPPARRVPLPTPYPLACARARARSRSSRQGGSSPPLPPSPPTCQLRRPPVRRVPLPTPYPLARA